MAPCLCYRPVMAVLAWIEDRPQDLDETQESATDEDPLGVAYRLTNLAAGAVRELAVASRESPAAILQRLADEGKPAKGR